MPLISPQDICAVLVTIEPAPEELERLAKLPLEDRTLQMRLAMDRFDIELREYLVNTELEVERLGAVGAWVLRGVGSVIGFVCSPEGPLAGTRFRVADNDMFFATSPSC